MFSPVRTSLRFSPLLCLLALFASPRVALASDGAEFISARQLYAAALTEHLNAQLALEQHALQGLDRLRSFGHASEQECDDRQLRVSRLDARLAAAQRFTQFLNELQAAANDSEGTSHQSPRSGRLLVMNPALLANVPAAVSPLVFLEATDTAIDELPTDVLSAERKRRDAELTAIGARETYLSERVNLLKKLHAACAGEAAEIRHLELVLAALRAEQRVLKCRPNTVASVAVAAGFSFREHTIAGAADVVRLVDEQWHKCLLQAEEEALASEQNLLSTFTDRLQTAKAAGATRPGELHQLTAKLRAIDHRHAQLKSRLAAFEAPEWQTLAGFPTNDRKTAELRIAEQRHRHSDRMARRVTALAQDDDFFAAEGRWWTQISRIHDSELAAARIQHNVQQARAALYSDDENSKFVKTASTASAASKKTQMLNRLKTLLTASETEASVRLAREQLKLAEQRAEALTMLHDEGHASPSEVAHARMLVAVTTAELSGAIADNELQRATVRLLDAFSESSPESQVTLR